MSLNISVAKNVNCGLLDEIGHVRPYRVLMSFSFKFVSVFINWLLFFRRQCSDISSIYILCLDKKVETLLPSYGLKCSQTYHLSTYTHHVLWVTRSRIAKNLLDKGFDVLMSDADALWLQNPFNLLQNYSTADVLGSRGTFPVDISSQMGATFCMGFMYIKSNPETKALWGHYLTVLAKSPRPDDQRDFNYMLRSLGLTYHSNNVTASNSNGFSIEANIGTASLHGKTIKFALLSGLTVRRHCDKNNITSIQRSIIAHCYVNEKVGSAKIQGGQHYELWDLKSNWDKVRFTNIHQYLRDISVKTENFSVFAEIQEYLDLKPKVVPKVNLTKVRQIHHKIPSGAFKSYHYHNLTSKMRPHIAPSQTFTGQNNLSVFNQTFTERLDSTYYTCGIMNEKEEIRPFKILMSFSVSFFEGFFNWLIYYRRQCPDTSVFHIICLDSVLEERLTKYGLRCSHTYVLGKLPINNLWLVRGRVAKQLLEKGYDVLMSDIDAIWLKNPFPILQKYNNSELIGSRAVFPEDVHKKYGATFCMGFIYLLSNDKTISLWGNFYGVMAKISDPDDQRDFNRMVSKMGLDYGKRLVAETTSVGFLPMEGKMVSLVLLSSGIVRRSCHHNRIAEIQSSIVAHCYVPQKEGFAKHKAGKLFQLWALRDDWLNIPFTGLDDFISKISILKLYH